LFRDMVYMKFLIKTYVSMPLWLVKMLVLTHSLYN